MGTKNNPSKFDCYKSAASDEPMFVLLARDPMAPFLVRIWALCREARNVAASNMLQVMLEELADTAIAHNDFVKAREAQECAQSMEAWYSANRKR